MDPLFDAVPRIMVIAFIVFGVLFIAAVVFIIMAATRNWRAAKNAGYDPLAMETQMAAQVMNSKLLQPAEPSGAGALEKRLAEIDDLRRRGVISEAEHAQARAQALRDL